MQIIHFCKVSEAYGCFSNFAPYPVSLSGKVWPTSEHYFQAQKFAGTAYEEEIRNAKSPMIAAHQGRDRKKPIRSDWEQAKDSIMREVVLAKFTQHPQLREILLSTGDAILVERTDRDPYWGDGKNRTGQNKLGQILMSVREEICNAETWERGRPARLF